MVNEAAQENSNPQPTAMHADAASRLAARVGKRIIVCCDGTSNQPNAGWPTNIVKIASGVAPVDSSGVPQIVFYDWGVGTGGGLDTITGGAFGWGLQRNVEDAYRFIVHNYVPGDQIFLFGFSRGAFTARSVAGLITQCSVLKSEFSNRIREGYAMYRSVDLNLTTRNPLSGAALTHTLCQ